MNDQNDPYYHVVFEFTKTGCQGIKFITTFPSKEYFDHWYTDEIKAGQTVVEKGVSWQRATEIIHPRG